MMQDGSSIQFKKHAFKFSIRSLQGYQKNRSSHLRCLKYYVLRIYHSTRNYKHKDNIKTGLRERVWEMTQDESSVVNNLKLKNELTDCGCLNYDNMQSR